MNSEYDIEDIIEKLKWKSLYVEQKLKIILWI